MPTTYPSTKQTFTNPAGTTLFTANDHAAQHSNANDTIAALEDTVGTTAGTNVMRNAAAGDFAITANSGGTFQQALFNPIFTSGTLKNVTLGTPTFQTPIYDSNSIPGSALATSAVLLKYTQITTNFTTSSSSAVQVTGLSGTITVPSGGRSVKITAYAPNINLTAVSGGYLSIWDGTVGSGTQLQQATMSERSSGDAWTVTAIIVVTPAAGTKTYNVGVLSTASTSLTVTASSGAPAFILCELI